MYWGLNPCKTGWIAIGLDHRTVRHELYETIIAFWSANHGDAERVLINIQIGLPSGPNERLADLEARKQVGRRNTNVFQTPTRQAMMYGAKHNFAKGVRSKASDLNYEINGKKIILQAWNTVPKIYEVDTFLRRTDSAQAVFMETHPEVIYWAFTGELMRYSKKLGIGFAERMQALLPHQPNLLQLLSSAYDTHSNGLEDDDVLDAFACAIAARCETIQTLPKQPPMDDEGLPMQLAYPETSAH